MTKILPKLYAFSHIVMDLSAERIRQDMKWGEQNHDDDRWLAILTEELGEIARALNEHDDENRNEELVQVAAVCVAWLEAIGRRGA